MKRAFRDSGLDVSCTNVASGEICSMVCATWTFTTRPSPFHGLGPSAGSEGRCVERVVVARSMLLVELALTVARNTRAEPDGKVGDSAALMAHEAISYGSVALPVPGGLAEQSDELEISAPFHARTVT